MKTCNVCQEQKELSLFPKASTCKDGHRNYCKVCHQKRKEVWRKENISHVREVQRAWVEQNLEKSRAIKRRWAKDNPEWQLENRRKARAENPQKFRASVSARRKRVQQSTPSWADMKAIRSFYENCPEGYHVDHVLPLRGKKVSGLHTIENLQYLLASDNMRKGAKFESNLTSR